MTLDEKIQIFTEYLENGGYEKINHIDLLEDMKLVQKDANGKAIPSTISPLVMAAINSVAIAKSDSFQPEPIITDTFVENYKHLKQKNLYFSQEQIDTPEQFDAIFEELSKKENTLFRGVKESKWRLNSSLQRQWISNEYKTKGINYKEFLEKLIENARTVNNESLRRYLNALNLDSENDIAILSFLQHQGSESFTPLLDWTYKFEHSLFFAIDRMKSFSKSESESEIDNYFSIYYLEEEFFEDGDLTAIVQKVLDENSENIFNGLIESLDGPKEKVESFVNSMTDNSKRLFAYQQSGRDAIRNITKIEKLINFPLAFFSEAKVYSPFKYSLVNNFNIINQKGAFTWNSSPNKPLEYVAKEEYLKENDEDYFFCNCLNINKALKFHVINKLDSLNINRNFIYPNPDDLANEAFKLTEKFYNP